MKTTLIIASLLLMLCTSVYKLYRKNEFKRVAKEGKQFIDEFMREGLTRADAYSRLTPQHRRAMDECKRLDLKY